MQLEGRRCLHSRTEQGDWYYEVKLVLNGPIDITRKFNVTVSWDQGGGLSEMGSTNFTVPGGSSPGQIMYSRFDTGSDTLGNQVVSGAVVV